MRASKSQLKIKGAMFFSGQQTSWTLPPKKANRKPGEPHSPGKAVQMVQ